MGERIGGGGVRRGEMLQVMSSSNCEFGLTAEADWDDWG